MDKQAVLESLNIPDYYSSELPSFKSNGSARANALCPFHNDTNPSLSIDLNTGVFNCFGCNESGSIFDFHMKGHNVDFKTALTELANRAGLSFSDFHPSKGNEKLKRSKPIETYDYFDKEGELVFQVCKTASKDFPQRRPDDKGGWIYNLNGVNTIIYNLSEVIKADIVYICEGEKDCNNLKTLGLVATTNPGGAGKWKPEYSQYLEGKDAVILSDNDQAGKNHAQKVASSLKGLAKNIKILELPNLPEKGDVSDWLEMMDARGTQDIVETLEDMIISTPEWEEPTQPSPFISSLDLVADPNHETIQWLVDGLIPCHNLDSRRTRKLQNLACLSPCKKC